MDPYFFAMSSTPLAAAALDSPSSEGASSAAVSRVGTIIDVPPVGDNVDSAENFVDNYDLDGEGGDDYTLCQKMVHYCGGGIVSDHWPACMAVLVFHAGQSLSKLSTMTKAVKEAAMMQLYTSTIEELDKIHFGDSAQVFSKLFQKKVEQITGLLLYRYYLDSCAKMRNHLIPLIPKDLVTMKSGRGFHKSCNDVVAKVFCDEQSLLKVKRGKDFFQSTQKQRSIPWFLLICGNILAKLLGFLDCASQNFVVILTLLQTL